MLFSKSSQSISNSCNNGVTCNRELFQITTQTFEAETEEKNARELVVACAHGLGSSVHGMRRHLSIDRDEDRNTAVSLLDLI